MPNGLGDIADGVVRTTTIPQNNDFVYVPMTVQETFVRPLAKRYPLAPGAHASKIEAASVQAVITPMPVPTSTGS
jgi:hypothetical protein